MLEFKVIEKLSPNEELLNAINTFDKKIIQGEIKAILNTNLKVIKPTTYIIKSPVKLTILEYQVNEINNKNFFIKEYKMKYNLKEILELLKSLNHYCFFAFKWGNIWGDNFMRCGIYVRVSTDEQRDNGYSIDSQLRMIKDYCEKNNYDIVDIYNDAGYSGKDFQGTSPAWGDTPIPDYYNYKASYKTI